MKKQRLKFSTTDLCLFVRHRNDKKLIVAIYGGDGLIAGVMKVRSMCFYIS